MVKLHITWTVGYEGANQAMTRQRLRVGGSSGVNCLEATLELIAMSYPGGTRYCA